MKKFRDRFLAAIAALALACMPLAAHAQQGFTLPPNSAISGHQSVSQAEAAPTGVGCTIAAGSTDLVGHCTASATSGSITFTSKGPTGTVGFLTAPSCLVVDASATSTVSMPVYTVSTTAITLSTIISAHLLEWVCFPPQGG